MSDFSLSHPTTKSGRDANVFAPQPDRDYAIVAETAWVDVQLAAIDIAEADTEAHTLSERLQAALLWFKEHGKTSPQYELAKTLQGELDARLDTLLLTLRIVSTAAWFQCCVTYAALQHVADRARWLADVAGNRFDGMSPHGVWRAVLPDRKEPGAWPLESHGWIERRMSYVETWNLDEQAIRLARRKQAA